MAGLAESLTPNRSIYETTPSGLLCSTIFFFCSIGECSSIGPRLTGTRERSCMPASTPRRWDDWLDPEGLFDQLPVCTMLLLLPCSLGWRRGEQPFKVCCCCPNVLQLLARTEKIGTCGRGRGHGHGERWFGWLDFEGFVNARALLRSHSYVLFSKKGLKYLRVCVCVLGNTEVIWLSGLGAFGPFEPF